MKINFNPTCSTSSSSLNPFTLKNEIEKSSKQICSTIRNVASGVNNVFPKLIFNNVEYVAAREDGRKKTERKMYQLIKGRKGSNFEPRFLNIWYGADKMSEFEILWPCLHIATSYDFMCKVRQHQNNHEIHIKKRSANERLCLEKREKGQRKTSLNPSDVSLRSSTFHSTVLSFSVNHTNFFFYGGTFFFSGYIKVNNSRCIFVRMFFFVSR